MPEICVRSRLRGVQPFLERIVRHLERVQRVAAREVVDADVPLDFGRFEEFSIRLFEQEPNPLPWFWVPTYLRRFVKELHWDILDGSGRTWSAEERFTVIEAAIVSASELGEEAFPSSLTEPRALLARSMSRAVTHRIGVGYYHSDPSGLPLWADAEQYCERLSLARSSTLLPPGSMLLRLNGVDRVRWLMAVESCLAASSVDPWCLDIDTIRKVSQEGRWPMHPVDATLDWMGEPSINLPTMERWMALGALRHVPNAKGEFPSMAVEVTSMGRDLFDELAADDATSFRILARALLEDEREQVLAPIVGHDRSQDRAATATLRHARMVAHEVRNALLPVQYALREVWADPALSSASIAPQRRTIEDGLARLHRFVDDSLRLTPIAAEVAEPFSVMEAVEEARRQLDPAPGGGVLIEARPGSADPRCRGHRGRFVLALLNVLRNAVQVGGPGVRVEIGIDARTPGRVTVSIRDDGPGLSEAQQASVFENGVSYRDGGSGHGLSFVRVVVQEEMGGTVRLISPPGGGGACFQLELPTHEETR